MKPAYAILLIVPLVASCKARKVENRQKIDEIYELIEYALMEHGDKPVEVIYYSVDEIGDTFHNTRIVSSHVTNQSKEYYWLRNPYYFYKITDDSVFHLGFQDSLNCTAFRKRQMLHTYENPIWRLDQFRKRYICCMYSFLKHETDSKWHIQDTAVFRKIRKVSDVNPTYYRSIWVNKTTNRIDSVKVVEDVLGTGLFRTKMYYYNYESGKTIDYNRLRRLLKNAKRTYRKFDIL